tara:strand:- start:2269 stop:2400 length:132 start_codon:yes stop_codon:yes gene_type:complete
MAGYFVLFVYYLFVAVLMRQTNNKQAYAKYNHNIVVQGESNVK